MDEIYLKNGGLLKEKDWLNLVNGFKQNVMKSNKDLVSDALVESIKKRLPSNKFGIFFSGGIDSSTIALLCKQNNADFICYTVGYDKSDDLVSARKVADSLGLEIREIKIDRDEVERLLKKVKNLLNLKFTSNERFTIVTDIVAAGVGVVIYKAVEVASEDNVDTFFSGLGSEEIFGGYDRHTEATDVNDECWNGLRRMWRRDLKRDVTLSSKLGVNLMTPYLDPNVILNAMAIPGNDKITGGYKKVILREISLDFGLPKEFAYRPKKAAQYGSRVNKAIEQLARKNGFKYKQDYLKML
jgi:diphthine-ammonia ligase